MLTLLLTSSSADSCRCYSWCNLEHHRAMIRAHKPHPISPMPQDVAAPHALEQRCANQKVIDAHTFAIEARWDVPNRRVPAPAICRAFCVTARHITLPIRRLVLAHAHCSPSPAVGLAIFLPTRAAVATAAAAITPAAAIAAIAAIAAAAAATTAATTAKTAQHGGLLI